MAKRIVFTDKNIKLIIDSPEKAYTLGFLWGDGHLKSFKRADGSVSDIHYISLEIIKDDLDQIINAFNVWGQWSIYFRKRKNRQEQGIITSFDNKFGWFLTINDYLTKSIVEPSKILSIIPGSLHQYWWRGFVDADGCFYSNGTTSQFSISGAFELNWIEATNLFNALKINKYQIQHRAHKKSKSSCIRISNKYDIINLGKYIYADNLSLGLNRKFNKFIEIKQKC